MWSGAKRFMVGGTGVAGMAAAAVIFAAAGSGANTPNPALAAHLKSLVMTDAARMGDRTPRDISFSALTTRNRALAAASGDQVGPPYGQTPSYLVVAHGNFTAYGVSPPGSAANPTGTVMTLVVDATTGQPTDSGIQGTTPDMSKLGPVTSLASN